MYIGYISGLRAAIMTVHSRSKRKIKLTWVLGWDKEIATVAASRELI